MTAVPIDRLGREPEHRRTYNPTRRNSRLVEHGRRERYPQLSKKEQWLRLFALKIFRTRLRERGQRWGAAGTISAGAVELYELILKLEARFGLVDPCVDWLAQQLNVPAKVIHAWKAQLQEHGFLFWERRCVETGADGRRGPQLHQTSNRYWTSLPVKAAELVSAVRRKMGLKLNPREVTEAEKGVMQPAARRRNDRLEERQREERMALQRRLNGLSEAMAQEAADPDGWRRGRTRIPPDPSIRTIQE
jgi:hypothetical protein